MSNVLLRQSTCLSTILRAPGASRIATGLFDASSSIRLLSSLRASSPGKDVKCPRSPLWQKATTRSFTTSPTRKARGKRATPASATPEPRVKIPFGAQSRDSLAQIFGQTDVEYETGNKVLRILHQRRVVGSLVDKGVQIAGSHNVKNDSLQNALAWLRQRYPVDEQAAAELWAENEAERLEGTYIARAEKLGLYKPLSGDEKQQELSTTTKSIYGVSVIDEFKKFHEDRRAREAKEKEESGETQRTQEMALAKREERESKQAVVEAKRAQRQERRALMGMVTPEPMPIPEMSNAARLGPCTAFGLSLVVLFWLGATFYTPPPNERRLFPDTPTAVATISTIAAINLAVYAMWHVPPIWRLLNRYMVQVASSPFWPSVLGNTFSHQRFIHLGANMACLAFYGASLHEDVGRGNFLALYLTGGVLGSLASLYYHVLTKSLLYYTFGASGAVWATMIGWGVLSLSKPLPDSESYYFAADVSRWTVIVFQALTHFAPGFSTRVDMLSHLGGAVSGGVSAWYLKWKSSTALDT